MEHQIPAIEKGLTGLEVERKANRMKIRLKKGLN
jgi:hypothetical protein